MKKSNAFLIFREGVFYWQEWHGFNRANNRAPYNMLKLTTKLHNQIKAHGAASYPFEGCGLLLGRVENGNNIVSEIKPMANVWPVEAEKPIRFLIDPKAWQQAELEAMSRDLDVIGVFHSHPDDVPVASPRDLAWASWPGYSYLITQVLKAEPTFSRSWQLKSDRSGFDEEEILVIGER